MKKILTSGCLVASCLATSAFADSDAYAVEAMLGKAGQRNSIAGYDTLSGSDTMRGLRLRVALNRAVDLELSYSDFGTAVDSEVDQFGDLSSDSLDSSAAQVGVRGSLPLSPTVALFGRVGLALWELDYQQTHSAFPGDIYRDSDEGSDAYFGVGLRVNLERNLYLGVEYNSLDFGATLGAASTDHEISGLGVSLGWSF